MQQFSSSFELSINAPSELWGEPETARQIQEEAEVLIPNIPQQESRIVESAVSFIWNWFQIDSELITKILSRQVEVEESTPPILISAEPRTHNPNYQTLYVKRLKFVPTIPEYPETHADGIGYVIPVAGLGEAAQEFPHDQVSKDRFKTDFESLSN